MEKIFKSFPATITSLPNDEIVGYFSVFEIDRYNEAIALGAFDKYLDTFRKQNVVLWSHQRSELPIGKVVQIESDETGLIGRVKLAVQENPQARIIRDLVKANYGPNSFSVGFLDHGSEANYELPDGHKVDRYYKDVELLELSLVNIPASPSSNITQRSFEAASEFTIRSPEAGKYQTVAEQTICMRSITTLLQAMGLERNPQKDFQTDNSEGVSRAEAVEMIKGLVPEVLGEMQKRFDDKLAEARGRISFPNE